MNDKHLSEIFKAEYSNLIAVLCHYYNVNDIQVAEDIVSEAFLQAMKSWSHSGIPENPKAWLRKVAVNKLKDNYRRNKTYTEKVLPHIPSEESEDKSHIVSDEILNDSQLRMIFVVCDPRLRNESQLCIALRILCGLSIEEIANALLTSKETVNKRLYRAKKTLKEASDFDMSLAHSAYSERLDNVLRVIYLLFNEGYYSSTKEEPIRQELCWEAMRLCVFLSQQDSFERKKVHALLALMCFHASRLGARMASDNGVILFDQQDINKWDQKLISKGERYLSLASHGNTISKYHLEAAIAYWHTTAATTKWEHILQLYNRLLTLEYSPVIAMNRTYALARANSVPKAIEEALKLGLEGNQFYYCLLAELYRLNNEKGKEKYYLNLALEATTKASESALIKEKLDQNAL